MFTHVRCTWCVNREDRTKEPGRYAGVYIVLLSFRRKRIDKIVVDGGNVKGSNHVV